MHGCDPRYSRGLGASGGIVMFWPSDWCVLSFTWPRRLLNPIPLRGLCFQRHPEKIGQRDQHPLRWILGSAGFPSIVMVSHCLAPYADLAKRGSRTMGKFLPLLIRFVDGRLITEAELALAGQCPNKEADVYREPLAFSSQQGKEPVRRISPSLRLRRRRGRREFSCACSRLPLVCLTTPI
jgi:hypothetical protein